MESRLRINPGVSEWDGYPAACNSCALSLKQERVNALRKVVAPLITRSITPLYLRDLMLGCVRRACLIFEMPQLNPPDAARESRCRRRPPGGFREDCRATPRLKHHGEP